MNTIEVISIPVSDQQRSKAFYRNIGFELMVENPMDEHNYWVQMKLPGTSTTISLVQHFPFPEIAMKPGSLQGLIFETEDIHAFVKILEKHGITYGSFTYSGFVEGEISQTPWGQFTHFFDPDGNGLSAHQE